MPSKYDSSPDFADLVTLFWRRRYWLLLAFCLSALAGVLLALLLPASYESRAELMPPAEALAARLLPEPLLSHDGRQALELSADELFLRMLRGLQSSQVRHQLYADYQQQAQALDAEAVALPRFLSDLQLEVPELRDKVPGAIAIARVGYQSADPQLALFVVQRYLQLAGERASEELQADFSALRAAELTSLEARMLLQRSRYQHRTASEKALAREALEQLAAVRGEQPGAGAGMGIQLSLAEGAQPRDLQLPPWLLGEDMQRAQQRYLNVRLQQLEARENADLFIEEMPGLLARQAQLQALVLQSLDEPYYRLLIEPQLPGSPASPNRPLVVALFTLFAMLMVMVVMMLHFIGARAAQRE